MLFGCKLRWVQKFPGTKQRARLMKSAAVVMLVSRLCAHEDRGRLQGQLVYTARTAPHSCLCTEALFISIDKRPGAMGKFLKHLNSYQ